MQGSRSAGVVRGRLGRGVLQHQVLADVHSGDQAARSSSMDIQQPQQQQQSAAGRPSSRSTPAIDTRRIVPGRSAGSASADVATRCRPSRSSCSTATTTEAAGRKTAAAAAAASGDNDQTSLPRPSTTSSTSGNAEKSEEELEKMRILARHIKVLYVYSAQCQPCIEWAVLLSPT